MTAVHAILPTNIPNESGNDCKIERDVCGYVRHREMRIHMYGTGRECFISYGKFWVVHAKIVRTLGKKETT